MNRRSSVRGRPSPLAALILTGALTGGPAAARPEEAAAPGLYARENLVAWCIVPFDAKQRGPEERAAMLERLGLKRLAYDWRPEHVPTFEDEILALQRHGIELFAFWDEHEAMFRLFEKHGLRPQVWKTAPSPPGNTDAERVDAAASALLPLAERTRRLGSKLGLYNHGGWGGEPANLVAVSRRLREKTGSDHIGIVYNLHHGHEHIGDFAEILSLMKPYLFCLNLNGMNDGARPKILPVGRGRHDRRLLEAIRESGYEGPIGIIDHREEKDAEESLEESLVGLERLAAEIEKERASSDAPYPPSAVIRRIEWGEEVLRLRPGSGDNWPITWVEDDLQIAAYGDGDGFGRGDADLSLGFARIIGDPPGHRAEDIESDADTPQGGGSAGIKASGLLMVEDTLYMFVRNYRPPGTDDFTNARLAWSEDRGARWTWADWHFADTFGCPDFIQFGPGGAGARDDYVYVCSQANDNAYEYSRDIVLARVSRDAVRDRERWEFFAGEVGGEPRWSPDIDDRRPVFTDPNGTQRISIIYSAPLRRYFLTTSHLPPGTRATHTAALGIFDAPEPWGPWTTVFYDHDWSRGARTYHHKLPPRWISEDGSTMWLLFSGLDGGYYDLCVKRITFELTSRPGAGSRE